jgi:hypothetical protein
MATNYGSDVSVFYNGAPGLDPTGALISGPRLVLEDCAKRLMTQPGTLLHDPAYGYDLMSKVGARVSAVGLARICGHIQEQLKRDERVGQEVKATITATGPGAWNVQISVPLAEGNFDLVLTVSSVTLTILRAAKS